MEKETPLSEKVFYENTDKGFPIFVKDVKDSDSEINYNPDSFLDVKDVAEAVKKVKEICDRGHDLEYPAQKKHFLKLIDEIFGEFK